MFTEAQIIAMLPPNWSQLGASAKVQFFKDKGVSVDNLLQAGMISQADAPWFISQGLTASPSLMTVANVPEQDLNTIRSAILNNDTKSGQSVAALAQQYGLSEKDLASVANIPVNELNQYFRDSGIPLGTMLTGTVQRTFGTEGNIRQLDKGEDVGTEQVIGTQDGKLLVQQYDAYGQPTGTRLSDPNPSDAQGWLQALGVVGSAIGAGNLVDSLFGGAGAGSSLAVAGVEGAASQAATTAYTNALAATGSTELASIAADVASGNVAAGLPVADAVSAGLASATDAAATGAVSSTGNIVGGGGNVISAGIGNIGTNLGTGLGNLGTNLGTGLGNIGSNLGQGLGTGLSEIGTNLGQGIGNLGTNLGTGLGTGLSEIGTNLGQGIGNLGTNLGTGLGTGLSEIGTNLGTGIGNIGTGLGNIGTSLGTGLSEIGSNLGTGIGNLGTGLGNIGTGLGAGLSEIGTNLGTGIGNLGTGLGNIGSSLGTGLGSIGTALGTGLGGLGTGIAQGLGQGLGNIASSLFSGITNAVSSVANTDAQNVLGNLISSGANLAMVNDAAQKLREQGKITQTEYANLATNIGGKYDALGKQASEMIGNFTPYGVTNSLFGTSYDPKTGAVNTALTEDARQMYNPFAQAAMQSAQAANMTNVDQLSRDYYNKLSALSAPETERQRLATEARLRAQGRLGVSGSAYGGSSPELLAQEQAIAQQQLQRELQSRQAALGERGTLINQGVSALSPLERLTQQQLAQAQLSGNLGQQQMAGNIARTQAFLQPSMAGLSQQANLQSMGLAGNLQAQQEALAGLLSSRQNVANQVLGTSGTTRSGGLLGGLLGNVLNPNAAGNLNTTGFGTGLGYGQQDIGLFI